MALTRRASRGRRSPAELLLALVDFAIDVKMKGNGGTSPDTTKSDSNARDSLGHAPALQCSGQGEHEEASATKNAPASRTERTCLKRK